MQQKAWSVESEENQFESRRFDESWQPEKIGDEVTQILGIQAEFT